VAGTAESDLPLLLCDAARPPAFKQNSNMAHFIGTHNHDASLGVALFN
jgi:hypothetical protein